MAITHLNVFGGRTVTLPYRLRTSHLYNLSVETPVILASSKLEPVQELNPPSVDSYHRKGSDSVIRSRTTTLSPVDSRYEFVPIKASSPEGGVAVAQTAVPRHFGSPFDTWPPSQTMSLRGLENGCHKPVDFYQPIFLTASDKRSLCKDNLLELIRHPPVIEPIDSLTMWKGLTLGDCETLIIIRGYLKYCLEQLLQPQFICFRARVLDEWPMMSPKSCAEAGRTETSVLHRFRFDSARLVQAVLDALDATAELHEVQHDTSPKELLILYLSSLNCLLDSRKQSPEHTAIDIQFRSCGILAALLPPVEQAQVVPTPDYVSFEYLDVLPLEGSSMVMKPHYHANLPEELQGSNLQVSYSIESNHPWIHWDSDLGAFKGHVPVYSRTRDIQAEFGQVCQLSSNGSSSVIHLLKVEVKATAVLGFAGSNVRLEKTIRQRVTLRVLPPPSDLIGLTMSIPYPRPENLRQNRIKHGAHPQPRLQHSRGASDDQTMREEDKESDCDSGHISEPSNSNPKSSTPPGVRFPRFTRFESYLPPHYNDLSFNTSHCSEIDTCSQQSVVSTSKYDDGAHDLEYQYTPRPSKRNDASRWTDASVSPKKCEREYQLRLATSSRAARHKPIAPTFEGDKPQLLVPAMGCSESFHHVEYRPVQQSEQTLAPKAAEEDVTLLEPLEYFNKFALLQDLSDESSAGSSIDGTGYYPTPPKSDTEHASSNPDAPGTPMRQSTPALLMPNTQSTDVGITHAGNKLTGNTLIGNYPLPPSSIRSDDDQEGGFDLDFLDDYAALKKVLHSKQAIEAFREPILSYPEKMQMFDALKMSVANLANTSSALRTRANLTNRSSSLRTRKDMHAMKAGSENKVCRSGDVDKENSNWNHYWDSDPDEEIEMWE
ncbi:MAG: hypothetical protein Q9172_003297 [Xanthocarpia lactea]